jgi:hypothetical protein
MDDNDLGRLRAKYATAAANETHDPAKRKLLEALFEGVGKRRLPYRGVPTFLEVPFKDGFNIRDLGANARW